MHDLALHQQGGAIPLSVISARLDISMSYLEQLFARARAITTTILLSND